MQFVFDFVFPPTHCTCILMYACACVSAAISRHCPAVNCVCHLHYSHAKMLANSKHAHNFFTVTTFKFNVHSLDFVKMLSLVERIFATYKQFY